MQLQAKDVDLVRDLLDQACAQVVSDLQLTDAQRQGIQQRCVAAAGKLAASRPGAHNHADGSDTMQEGTTADPLSQACTQDANVAELVQQVSATARRVHELKTSASSTVARAAQQHLAAQRPQLSGVQRAQQVLAQSQAALPGHGVMSPLASDVGNQGALPWAEEYSRLRQQLSQLMDQLPGMRSSLEQSEQRLSVNIMAVESDQAFNRTPRTGQRASRECPDPAFSKRPLVARSPPPAMAQLPAMAQDTQ